MVPSAAVLLNLLVCRDEVGGLLVSKLHIVPQHVDIEQLPHILLAVVLCKDPQEHLSRPVYTNRVPSWSTACGRQTGRACHDVAGRELLPDLAQLLVHARLLLLLVLGGPDVRDEHLPPPPRASLHLSLPRLSLLPPQSQPPGLHGPHLQPAHVDELGHVGCARATPAAPAAPAAPRAPRPGAGAGRRRGGRPGAARCQRPWRGGAGAGAAWRGAGRGGGGRGRSGGVGWEKAGGPALGVVLWWRCWHCSGFLPGHFYRHFYRSLLPSTALVAVSGACLPRAEWCLCLYGPVCTCTLILVLSVPAPTHLAVAIALLLSPASGCNNIETMLLVLSNSIVISCWPGSEGFDECCIRVCVCLNAVSSTNLEILESMQLPLQSRYQGGLFWCSVQWLCLRCF